MGIGDSIVSKVSTWRGGVTVNACEPHLLFRTGLSWQCGGPRHLSGSGYMYVMVLLEKLVIEEEEIGDRG